MNHRAPKRRIYGVPPRSTPVQEEWNQFLAGTSLNRGMEAEVVQRARLQWLLLRTLWVPRVAVPCASEIAQRAPFGVPAPAVRSAPDIGRDVDLDDYVLGLRSGRGRRGGRRRT